MKSCEFVVPTRTDEECPEGYEEMTFEDFFEKYELTDVEQKEFIDKHYAINIHWCYHSGNIDRIHEIISDIKSDPRLAKLNAIVFLALKKKGRGKGFKPVTFDQFKVMVENCLFHDIRFGMDSCSAGSMMKFIKDSGKYKNLISSIEPCESTRMSMYVDVHGDFYPCSFCEGTKDWKTGLSIIECNDFLTDIWGNDKTVAFRNKCISSNSLDIGCQIYQINS